MDIQIKKGFLDICVLKALKSGESYGYKIMKDLRPYVIITESTLYPILNRLEKEHYINITRHKEDTRDRRYCTVTPKGLDRLAMFKNDWREIMQMYDYITK